ncbi:O-antigen ligase family protein [Endozoicomonas atrinae]|uniref:O-antigen ligase family protein n=1 Tax=Endozoicomonas atrinae TaxID=1333660 RepID=UPI0008261409|nr:O-antigen ligase family protein [Endozoicomonas atrinae]
MHNVYAITQYIAFYLLLSVPDTQSKSALLVKGILYFVILFALFATYSRSAIAVWLFSFGGVVFLSTIKTVFSKKKLIIIGFLALLAYFLVSILPDLWGEQSVVRGFHDLGKLGGRTYIWDVTWSYIQTMPWFGYGLGTFINLYSGLRYEYSTLGVFVHNDYLQFLLEGGPLFLALLLVYLAFYVWLGFKILFEKKERIAASKNNYKELLACIAIAVSLSAHAIMNYVFYVLSIQILVGLVLARTVYLSKELGYLRASKAHYGRLTLAVPLTLIILISSLTVMAVSRKAFLDIGEVPIPSSWVKSKVVAEKILIVDSDNQVAWMFMFNQLFYSLDSVDENQQQEIINLLFDIGERLIDIYPYHSDYYWRQGVLLEKASLLGVQLQTQGDITPADYFQKSINLNPGNMLANKSMFSVMLADERYEEAGMLVETALKWVRLLTVEEQEILTDMIASLPPSVSVSVSMFSKGD